MSPVSKPVASLLAFLPFFASAKSFGHKDHCTALAVDAAATKDGSAFAGANADSGAGDYRLAYVPSKDYEEGAKRPVYPQKLDYPRFVGHGRGKLYHPKHYPDYKENEAIAYIPEVSHTYGYYESTQPLMNEHGLGIGESSCGAMLMNKALGDKTDTRDVPVGLLDTSALMQLALERCTTSRCAVETMGSLAEEFGFGPTPGEVAGVGTCDDGYPCWDDAGEAYTFADKAGDAWVFHIVGGVKGIMNSIWAAQRVPKGHVAFVANEFTIEDLPDEPNDDYLFNPKIRDAAIAAKLWNGKGVLNWVNVFAPKPTTFQASPGATPIPLYGSLRRWGLMNLAAPSLKLQFVPNGNKLPFSVPADKKLSQHDVLDFLRYYYQGTEFDLTLGVLAGPLGNPFRLEGGPKSGNIPRGISIQRTLYGGITQTRANKSLAWFALDTPLTSVYVPLFSQTHAIADVYAIGNQLKFDRKSAGWAFNLVSNLLTWNYRDMSKNEVYPAIEKWQDKIDKEMDDLDTSDVDQVADWQESIQKRVVKSWWDMSDFLIMKYNDGMINYPKTGKAVGYPQGFADMIGFSQDAHPIWVQPASNPPSSIQWMEQFPLPTIWNGITRQWYYASTPLEASAMMPTADFPSLLVMIISLAVTMIFGVTVGRAYERSTNKAGSAYLPLM